MNKIFTLFVMTFCALTSNAQVTEGFENTGGLPYYQTQGWQFYGASWDGTSKVNGIGSIYVLPPTSTINNNFAQSNTVQLVTPTMNLNNGATFQFAYKLASSLSKNATRTVTVRLYDGTQFTTNLLTLVLDNKIAANLVHLSPSVVIPPGSGNQKMVVDFTGSGDGNTGMYYDNMISSANYSSAIILPVRLLNFAGTSQQNGSQLQWQVADNQEGDHFELEYSKNGSGYTTEGLIFSTAINGTESYSYKSAKTEGWFRLKAVNKNNSISYSKAIYLGAVAKTEGRNIQLLQNPVASTITFKYTATNSQSVSIKVYNLAGAQLTTSTAQVQKGANMLAVNLDTHVAAGTYVMQVQGGTTIESIKFSKK